MSNVVLFGAGASYGAGDIMPYNPPLGHQLFEALARYSPHTWGSLHDDVSKQFKLNSNFEPGMRAIWERSDQARPELPNLLRDMAHYLSQFRLLRYLLIYQ